jgi:hypothetical protein
LRVFKVSSSFFPKHFLYTSGLICATGRWFIGYKKPCYQIHVLQDNQTLFDSSLRRELFKYIIMEVYYEQEMVDAAGIAAGSSRTPDDRVPD